MSGATAHEERVPPGLGRWAGIVVGLAITAASMSSGFIWASQGKVLLVYVAGFFSWTGYLAAHYAAEGVFVDDASGHGSPDDAAEGDRAPGGDGEEPADGDSAGPIRTVVREIRGVLPADPRDAVGFLFGIALLVAGIAVLAWFVRQQNHLLGNLGSGSFLAGYVIAHLFDTGKPL